MADQNFKTSFIPAKPIQPVSRGGGLGRGGHASFLNIITLIIFLIALVISGVMYGWRVYLEGQVEKQLLQLADVRKSLDSPLVNQADRLNSRIESVKTLLANHLAPSELFRLLEQTTLKTVQLNNFDYQVGADGVITMSADGQALEYESIVLQSKQYGDTGFLRNILFSGLQPNQQTGGITYDVEGTVDAPLVSYKKRVEFESNTGTSGNSGSGNTNSAGDSFEFPGGQQN